MMNKNNINTRFLLTIFFLISITYTSFSQRVYSNSQLLKKGIEAAYYLKKGDENSLNNFILNIEGLKLETTMSKSNYFVFEKYFYYPNDKSQSLLHYLGLTVDKRDPKSQRITIFYTYSENGIEYDLKSSFLNELKHKTALESIKDDMFFVLKKGDNNEIQELPDFFCVVIPLNEFKDSIKCQFGIIKDTGKYSLEEILAGL
jgi:hypothetical protein